VLLKQDGKMRNLKIGIYININIILACIILISIIFIDRPLSAFIDNYLKWGQPFFLNFTIFFDKILVHIFWFLMFFIVSGLFLIFSKRTKKVGFIFLTVVFTNFIAYGVITAKLKMEFKRARPNLYLNGGEQTADFYNEQAIDYSYPSLHAAFYLSLFLPFTLVFKRYAPLILFIPGVITVGRVVQNDHYLSDILTSLLIVFNVFLFIYWLFCWVDNYRINFKIKRVEKRHLQ
jgi:membrane-associated phospholipid phosphatase